MNENDRVALVWGNGVGKTTLMRMIAGDITEYDGSINNLWGISIGYLAQIHFDDESRTVRQDLEDAFDNLKKMEAELAILEERMASEEDNESVVHEYGDLLHTFQMHGGYEYHHTVNKVADGLGIITLLDRPLSQVSGWERTKVALAKILLLAPDFLLLDEPTNFIDLAGIEWLENYLHYKWRGGYLIISHDREFLDKTCTLTVEMQPCRPVSLYHGNYTFYIEERAKREAKAIEDWEHDQEFIKKEEVLINRFRAGSRAGFAKSREKALEKHEEVEKPWIPIKPRFIFTFSTESWDKVLYAKECFIGRTDPLFFIREVSVMRGQRVGIMGDNGCGKSTFIKTFLEKIEPLEGTLRQWKWVEIVYYSQMHEELDRELTLRDNCMKHGLGLTDQQLMGILGNYLFNIHDLNKKIAHMSGWQVSRALFAIIGQKPSNVLVFDEPTNHLDYDSRESLERSLHEYKGTLIFISHDRYFINKISTHLLLVRNDEMMVSYGNYEDFQYKNSHGLDLDMSLFQWWSELDTVLIEKVWLKEAKRLKEKYGKKK